MSLGSFFLESGYDAKFASRFIQEIKSNNILNVYVFLNIYGIKLCECRKIFTNIVSLFGFCNAIFCRHFHAPIIKTQKMFITNSFCLNMNVFFSYIFMV